MKVILAQSLAHFSGTMTSPSKERERNIFANLVVVRAEKYTIYCLEWNFGWVAMGTFG